MPPPLSAALRRAPFAIAALLAALSPRRAAKIRALIDTSDLATLQEAMWQGKVTSGELTTDHLARIVTSDGRTARRS